MVFSVAFAQSLDLSLDLKSTTVFSTKKGAISGYDAVAYFTAGKPVKGKEAFSTEYRGATWYFSSQKNLDIFLKDSLAYAPQYGGYCAYAMSSGYLASTNPRAWSIHENKLYLNYSIGVRRSWLRDKPGHIRNADRNWPRFR